MNERKPPGSPNELGERIKRLRETQDTAKHGRSGDAPPRSGLGLAMRIGVELVAALVVGVALGYGLDTLFGTKPLLSLLGFFFGAAAGFLNVYRVATGQGSTVGYKRPPDDIGGNGEKQDTNRDTSGD